MLLAVDGEPWCILLETGGAAWSTLCDVDAGAWRMRSEAASCMETVYSDLGPTDGEARRMLLEADGEAPLIVRDGD